jgi:23S rRNA (adenine2503-C2)-methyltransferase
MLYNAPMPQPSELSIISLPAMQELVRDLGFPAFRAKQILDWRNKGMLDPLTMPNVPKDVRQAVADALGTPPLSLVKREYSRDGTRKYLFALREGGHVETVMIPERKRITVCISSQVGCVLDCPFCFTGRQKFEKNLTAAEIVAQVWMVTADLLQQPVGHSIAERPTHLVYMGMGEPLANEAGLHGSLGFFLAEDGLHISRRRITVSTSGLLPQITRLGEVYPVNLAISLHAANNSKRDVLVPINKKYPLEALRHVLDAYPLPEQRYITLEYVMLAGVNDQDEDLQALVRFVRAKREFVNLIHFNPHPGSEYRATSQDAMDDFATRLIARGLRATVRRSRGDDIMAACGQLNAHMNPNGEHNNA